MTLTRSSSLSENGWFSDDTRADGPLATARLEPWIAERADGNRDGVVDVTHFRIFEAMHGLDRKPVDEDGPGDEPQLRKVTH